MRQIQKILIEQATGKKYFVKDLNEDFHTSQGIVKSSELKLNKNVVTSAKGKEFLLLEPSFADLWEALQRGPQVLLPKDIGWIIAKTGINRNSKIVDAGGGSGSLCLSLANLCKEITVYEINPEHHSIVVKNAEMFGIENITIKQENIYNGIVEKDLDLITLDLPEPWQVLKHAEKALKLGGFLVVYLPNLWQVKQFIDSANRSEIKVSETIELIERKWKIEDKIMRPEFEMLGHTGFLVLGRKLN